LWHWRRNALQNSPYFGDLYAQQPARYAWFMGRKVDVVVARLSLGVVILGATLGSCLGCTVDDTVGDRVTANVPVEAGTPDATASDPSCAGTLFCTSFEQGVTGFDTVENGGTLAVAAPGFDDQAALQPEIAEGSGTAYIHTALNRPGVSELYLRGYVRVAADAVIEDVAIFFLGPAGGFAGVNVDLRSDDRFELFLPEHDMSLISDPGTFARDTWHCLQLQLQIDELNGAVTLLLDGQEVISQTALDTYPGEDFDLFTVGIEWSMADQGPIDLLLDDVTLSETPVECL
jgi:hypothetical protein